MLINTGATMQYPAKIIRQAADNYAVTFPDIPEAFTLGDSVDDALRNAVDALETALDFYFEHDRIVPSPSSPKRGQHLVELPASVSAKVLLFNELLSQNL
jgi:antitoxin HicB